VPKNVPQLKTCKDVRKIASTSDYAKVFESLLRTWIVTDIGHKVHINQFAGKKGVGVEHMIVMLMDRVLHLLDAPGMSAVVLGAVDWMGAFDRQDPTITVQKLIKMGVRSSIIPIIIDFLEDRKMQVRFNSAKSKWHDLVGGTPQGSWNGQNCYIVASDDNAESVEEENQFKYCDDLSIVELVMIGNILTEYNFIEHVASDVGIDQKFLPTQQFETQSHLNSIATWTDENLMRLNEDKTNYIIFTRTKQQFATRLTVNGKLLERKEAVKICGVWLQEDGSWEKNTKELCRKAYARLGMLTKLKYAGVGVEDLVQLYKMFIRSRLEFCGVAFHSGLTQQQSDSLERCEAVCLRVILQESYVSHDAACEMLGLERLAVRRQARCLSYSLKALKHPQNLRMFPRNPNIDIDFRSREPFTVNFGRTEAYRRSTIPYCQRLLNSRTIGGSEDGGAGVERRGEGM
jgi:hypothetical protein